MKRIQKILVVFAGLSIVLHADNTLIAFYKEALKTLSYQDTYALQQKSRALNIEAKEKQRYLNLDAGIIYGALRIKSQKKALGIERKAQYITWNTQY